MKVIAGKDEDEGTETGGDDYIRLPQFSWDNFGSCHLFLRDVSDSTGLSTVIGSGSNNFSIMDEETDFSSDNWLDLVQANMRFTRANWRNSFFISRVYGEDLNLVEIIK